MTSNQIKTILDRFGVDYTEENIQLPQIYTILGTTNQGVDYRKDFFTFDFDNELIKIKKYKPKAVNGRVTRFSQSSRSLKPYGPEISLCHPLFPFRQPRTGDYVYGLSRKTFEIEESYIILDAGLKYIVIDSEDKLDQKTYCYLYSTETLINSATQDPLDKSLFLTYELLTDNTYDIILDMSQIIGFEIKSERINNGGL